MLESHDLVTTQPNPVEDIDSFYLKRNETPYNRDRNSYDEEVRIFSDVLRSPTKARKLLEIKLDHLARSSGFRDIQEMEANLNIDKSLDTYTAARARLGHGENDTVYLHTAKDKSVFVDDVTRKTLVSKIESRLFWTRGANGELIEVSTDYPHLDHDSIYITDDEVVTSRVVRPINSFETESEMQLNSESIIKASESFVSRFDIHNKRQPLRIKVTKILERLRK